MSNNDLNRGNPYPEGTGEHLLYAIFGEFPGPDACECGMPTECPPLPTAQRDRPQCILCGEPITPGQITAAWVIADGAHRACVQQVTG